MRERQARLDAVNARVVLISFEPPAALADYGRRQRLPYELLSDEALLSYDAFGLGRKGGPRLLTPGIVAVYLRGLVRGRWPRLTTSDRGRLGGNVVVDRAGRVVYLYRSTVAEDRPPIDELLRALGEAG